VLYIGLGVDFGIHFGMGYASHTREGQPHASALRSAAGSIGPSLALCTLTTAIGFAVFVPTDYRGLAELGLIAAGGMFVILFLFLTFFPALLSSWLQLDSSNSLRGDLHFQLGWWKPFQRRPGVVVLVAGIAFVGSLSLLPRNRFDPNVIDMRDPGTESVEAFNDLLSEPGTAPWYINVVEADLQSAQALADRIQKLPAVERAITLADFVPDQQDEKLEILGDIAMLLDVPAGSKGSDAELSTDEQIQTIRELHDFFGAPWMQEWQSESGRLLEASIAKLRTHLADFLARIEREENAEEALDNLAEVLFAGLPDQIARLRTAVNTGPVGFDDIPAELSQRMLAADGRARVQIFPSRDLSDLEAMKEFVSEVQAVAPGANSVIVNLIEFGDVTVSAFVQALLSAAAVIFALLFGIWRSFRDSALAMAPLLLAAALTGAAMVLLDLPFDFSNVIVIPLLFGIGVDSGIHLVHRWKLQQATSDFLLKTTTARAVFYSALTTTVSFGSLAFSSHNGMSILGTLLTVGMLFTVLCNLVVLPALLDLASRMRWMKESPKAAPPSAG
jgi:hopanoid biosynthesis associated RND transporter like protein HpnN